MKRTVIIGIEMNTIYIVNIGDDKWVIMSSNDHTRELLDDYIWRCLSGYAVSEEGRGNAKTHVKMHTHKC